MRIIFSGGGTLGPVTPLLALYETIKARYPEASFLWIGTKQGPERVLIEKAGIRFKTLNAGKFRRYLSLWNISDVFHIIVGFFKSLKIIWKENPDFCVSAGGYVSVPLHWAAFFLGIPTWIHQQDLKIGLANRLMAPVARVVSTAFQKQLTEFPKKKVRWLGNPVRRELLEGTRSSALKRFGLRSDMPVIFVTGGGTGSLKVNQLMVEALPHLKHVCQILHLSGLERPQELVQRAGRLFSDFYHAYQFFTEEMKDAYAVADVVISRGGFGSLTEIAALGKAAIVIPKPGHQVLNVDFLERSEAILYLDERVADALSLVALIKEILEDRILRSKLERNLQKILPRAREKDTLEIVTYCTN